MTNITNGLITEYFDKYQLLGLPGTKLEITPRHINYMNPEPEFMTVRLALEDEQIGDRRGGKGGHTFLVSTSNGDILSLTAFGTGEGYTALLSGIEAFYRYESFQRFLRDERVIVGNVLQMSSALPGYDDPNWATVKNTALTFAAQQFGEQYAEERLFQTPLFWHISDQPDEYYEHSGDPQYMMIGSGGIILVKRTGEMYRLGSAPPMSRFAEAETYEELKQMLDEKAHPFNGGTNG